MTSNIDDLRAGILRAKELGEGMFGQNTTEFCTFMCGVLATAVDDLADHIQELEERCSR